MEESPQALNHQFRAAFLDDRLMLAKTDVTAVQENVTANPTRRFPNLFLLRLLVLALIAAGLMSLFNINIGSIGQGLSYSLVGVAVFLTFRILRIPDLTVDGAFAVGGAVCAAMIVAGTQAEVTLFAALLAGALAGLITALITVLLRIEGLLASIIVITGAYTVTLRILEARSNLPLLNERTILTPYQIPVRTWLVDTFGDQMRRQSNNVVEILVIGAVVVVVLLFLNWFMHTELGLTIRAAGQNSQLVRALGINHQIMIVLTLMIANGLVGLAGALTVQQLGFADVSLGFGVIIRGLAAVMIGEVLLRPRSVGQRIAAAALGMIIFDISRAWVFAALDLPTTDIRLVSALVVLVALAAPRLAEQWNGWQKKRKRRQQGSA
jgi:putative ABC transport system permease protein